MNNLEIPRIKKVRNFSSFFQNINAFKNNPTYKSSLKFLRTTPWAREKVEQFYLKNMID